MSNPRAIIRWILAELLGTAVLTMAMAVMFTQTASNVQNFAYIPLFLPFGGAVTLLVIVALFGSPEGIHVNPAITLGHFVFRKISASRAGVYVVSQIIGAYLGIAIAHLLLASTNATPPVEMTTPGVLAEFIGAFLLGFSFMCVTVKRVSFAQAPLVLGATFALGGTLALGAGTMFFNPAISLAFGAYGWMYLFIPFLGALGGSALAVIFDEESDHESPHKK